MWEVWTAKGSRSAEYGFFWWIGDRLRAFSDGLGRHEGVAILCNPPLPGDSPAVRLLEMDVPLPARIQTTRTRQTTQFPGRLRRKPARKRVG
jgi:hypothetical protein